MSACGVGGRQAPTDAGHQRAFPTCAARRARQKAASIRRFELPAGHWQGGVAMNTDERATKVNGMSRRSFIKAGGAVLGGAAIPGLNLETGALEALAADAGRPLRDGGAADVGMSQARLDDVLARVQNRIARGLMPGAVVLVARPGQVVLPEAIGPKEAGKDAMTKYTLFDLESNTQVLATAIAYTPLIVRGVVRRSCP